MYTRRAATYVYEVRKDDYVSFKGCTETMKEWSLLRSGTLRTPTVTKGRLDDLEVSSTDPVRTSRKGSRVCQGRDKILLQTPHSPSWKALSRETLVDPLGLQRPALQMLRVPFAVGAAGGMHICEARVLEMDEIVRDTRETVC